jgi:ATP-binding cassette subfamily B protein
MSAPAIAAAPKRRGSASDLGRLLPYLRPYRARWIVMISAAIASLGATVGIPIMTRAVIDGPGRHHDQRGLWVLGSAAMAVGLSEAAMLFIRRWLTAHATVGAESDIRRDLLTAASRIAEIFDAPCEITDGPHVDPVRSGRLELRDVGFRIPDAVQGDRWLLRHVTLRVEPGEILALVGPTGAGKSLLTALLSRVYDVCEGQILLDGRDIRQLSLAALRQAVSTAFDEPTVFSMTVAENLRLGRPDATDAELAAAIDIVSAQFVYQLPFGQDTRIGEQGMRLSGGQRQQLCLARAIIAAPKLLVIDDTLSGLDAHTEAEVTDALRRALRGVTRIVVARRLSTVLLADRVALLDNGTITHVGTHAELFAQVPRYRYLMTTEEECDDDTDCAAIDLAMMTAERQ